MSETQFVYVTYIASTPDKVWTALTDADVSAHYWSYSIQSDWKAGSPWRLVRADKNAKLANLGEVMESTPPTRLVLTWADPATPLDKSRVTFTVEPVADMVRLTVTHDRLQLGSVMFAGIADGWPRVFSSLKTYLETGRPLDARAGKAA